MAAEDGQEMPMSAVNSADQCPAVAKGLTRHHGGSTVQPSKGDRYSTALEQLRPQNEDIFTLGT